MSAYAKLVEEWSELLARRPTFRDSLAPYRAILEAWVRWPADAIKPLAWSADECRSRWQRGVPLLTDAPPSVPPDEMEELVGAALEFLAAVGTEPARLQRLAGAWDAGEIGPSAFFPGRGRLGVHGLGEGLGLSAEIVAFVASASLRPILDAYFNEARAHQPDTWDLGICPFCGAPPGFADLVEDGRCRLACHLCGSAWTFSRLRCPLCGNRTPQDLVRLTAEDLREEGYFVEACKQCWGYVKSLDRRTRWNAGSALAEDWGSPHLDLIAHRRGYWRPVPSIVQLLGRA